MNQTIDVVEWLQERAFRMYGPTMEAAHTKTKEWLWADEITRLRAENEKLREENDGWQMDGASCANEVKYLRADLAAVTAERDRMRDALRPFVRRLEVLEETIVHKYAIGTDIDVIHLRAARAALEGVTEPPR